MSLRKLLQLLVVSVLLLVTPAEARSADMDIGELVIKLRFRVQDSDRSRFVSALEEFAIRAGFQEKRKLENIPLGERRFLDLWFYQADGPVTIYVSDILERGRMDIMLYQGKGGNGRHECEIAVEEVRSTLSSAFDLEELAD